MWQHQQTVTCGANVVRPVVEIDEPCHETRAISGGMRSTDILSIPMLPFHAYTKELQQCRLANA